MTTRQSRWEVEFYTDARGRSPVVEFINGLSEREQTAVGRHLLLLQEFGVHLGAPYTRPITGHRKLWELRPGPIRLLYFAHTGRRFVILHAFRKKSRKTPKREIAIAEGRMATFLEGER
ncbi:MAG: type II toxin-antitoxin system RelE/ParE family toxin [Anaerolineae bacterium]